MGLHGRGPHYRSFRSSTRRAYHHDRRGPTMTATAYMAYRATRGRANGVRGTERLVKRPGPPTQCTRHVELHGHIYVAFVRQHEGLTLRTIRRAMLLPTIIATERRESKRVYVLHMSVVPRGLSRTHLKRPKFSLQTRVRRPSSIG